jgi:hypothetical protein
MTANTRTFREKCILVFGTIHALFLIVAITPPAVRDRYLFGAAIRFYEACTTSLQQWSMFYTIPDIHRLDIRFSIRTPKQSVRFEGIVLPGLKPYPKPENYRFYGWVAEVILSKSNGEQREAYMRRVALELLHKKHYPPESTISLDLDAYYTRSLLGVRKLREIAVKRTSSMGPFRLTDLVKKSDPTH